MQKKENEAALRDILKNVISDIENKERSEGDIPETWRKIVGSKAAGHTKPEFLKGKRLVVKVSDSSWLYKLTLEKKSLLEKLNKALGSRKKIKELQFRIGDIK